MARCPYCGKVLKDRWVKKQGAALMGKASGAAKARSKEIASRAQAASVAAKRAKKNQTEV